MDKKRALQLWKGNSGSGAWENIIEADRKVLHVCGKLCSVGTAGTRIFPVRLYPAGGSGTDEGVHEADDEDRTE